MNRKIAMSLLSSAIMITIVTRATFAYFNNAGTSSANTFSTGTLDLKLTDTNETSQDNVTASFGGTLAPGGCTGNQTISLRNVGTIAANHAEVALSNVVTDTDNDANPDIDSFLTIDTLQYDGGNVISQIPDTNGNTRQDLSDWAANPSVLDDLALTNLNTDHSLVLNVCLDSSAGNTIQGDSIASTFTVTLNQHSSQ